MAVISLTGEEILWEMLNHEEWTPNADSYWVGDHPRLDVADEDVRYARVWSADTGIAYYTGVAVRLAPFAWPDGGIRIRAQARPDVGWWGGVGSTAWLAVGVFTLSAGPGWDEVRIEDGFTNDATFTVGSWGISETPFSVHSKEDDIRAAAAAGHAWMFATFNGAGDISWLQLETPGVQPLQWRQHDFMGMSARTGTSYWRTNQARGML